MKKTTDLLCIANIAIIVYFLVPFGTLVFSPAYFDELLNMFFKSIIGQLCYLVLACSTFIFWIFCLRKALKAKDNTRIALLFFMNVIYSPYYYLFLLRKKL